MDEIKIEILKGSYWEHFKLAKDLALILPVDNPRRKKIEEEANRINIQLNEVLKKNDNS